jgi:glycosyltransferase involved in cell wall biosynthesis
MALATMALARFTLKEYIDVTIDYMELRYRDLLPTYFVWKGMFRRMIIYRSQGQDLLDPESKKKNLADDDELSLCATIVLYAEYLKKYIPARLRKKTCVANHTLGVEYAGLATGMTREDVPARRCIRAKKNFICVGRMKKRKRFDHATMALAGLSRPNIRLILVGPNAEGVLDDNDLWQKFSQTAKWEIAEKGKMVGFCTGFRDALIHANGGADLGSHRVKP